MKSMQDYILEQFAALTEGEELVPTTSKAWDNIGHLYAVRPADHVTVATLEFEFDHEYCTLKIDGGGAPLFSGPSLRYTDSTRLREALTTWQNLLLTGHPRPVVAQ